MPLLRHNFTLQFVEVGYMDDPKNQLSLDSNLLMLIKFKEERTESTILQLIGETNQLQDR